MINTVINHSSPLARHYPGTRTATAPAPQAPPHDEVELSPHKMEARSTAEGQQGQAPVAREHLWNAVSRSVAAQAPVGPTGPVVSGVAAKELQDLFESLHEEGVNFRLWGSYEWVSPRRAATRLAVTGDFERVGLDVLEKSGFTDVDGWSDLRALETLHLTHDYSAHPDGSILAAIGHVAGEGVGMNDIIGDGHPAGPFRAYQILSHGKPLLVGGRHSVVSAEDFEQVAFFELGYASPTLEADRLAKSLKTLESQNFTFHHEGEKFPARFAWKAFSEGRWDSIGLGVHGAEFSSLTAERLAEPDFMESLQKESSEVNRLWSKFMAAKPIREQFAELVDYCNSGREEELQSLVELYRPLYQYPLRRALRDLRTLETGELPSFSKDAGEALASLTAQRRDQLSKEIAADEKTVNLHITSWAKKDLALLLDTRNPGQSVTEAAEKLVECHQLVAATGGPEAGHYLFLERQLDPGSALMDQLEPLVKIHTELKSHLVPAPTPGGDIRSREEFYEACFDQYEAVWSAEDPKQAAATLALIHQRVGAPLKSVKATNWVYPAVAAAGLSKGIEPLLDAHAGKLASKDNTIFKSLDADYATVAARPDPARAAARLANLYKAFEGHLNAEQISTLGKVALDAEPALWSQVEPLFGSYSKQLLADATALALVPEAQNERGIALAAQLRTRIPQVTEAPSLALRTLVRLESPDSGFEVLDGLIDGVKGRATWTQVESALEYVLEESARSDRPAQEVLSETLVRWASTGELGKPVEDRDFEISEDFIEIGDVAIPLQE